MTHIPEQNRRRLVVAIAAALTLGASGKGRAAADTAQSIRQPELPGEAAFIERAFAMQRDALASGDQGYGAVVVREDAIVGQSASHVVVHRDPTAHAEMEAIRDAARRLGNRDLSGCILYSSSPPCPMCEAAAYWAGIERMVYGKTARDGGRPGLC